ncbi:Isochorismate synthase EntC [Mariniflexile rhizosphaerae]|uniref:chorismate-binding protein n=1 Tax=unclassified Mariniflexile TaxID=2643887 RepID=UPI000CC2C03F|nr:chorismate-binding protein [Mariniflexile sp. TRM1-10]AXP82694.1 Isochorismate synthase EntC [Mariniflexile sp. TRM1-10]PLB18902.1 MAG: Isochorismate synthase family protein [Flavobacteriaceae bacterium FS1-H7996/R]
MTSEDFFKRIEQQYHNELPFVVYRKPNKSDINGLLQSHNELISIKDFTEKGFVFAPFDDLETSVLIPFDGSEVISLSSLMPSDIGITENKKIINEQEKQQHIDLVKKGVEAIEAKDFKKVVLSRQEHVLIAETNPIVIFKRLLSTYTSSFIYCWYHPKVGLWLGATPETLIKIEGSQFSIMALAGTQVYKGNLDVIWQDKEKQEQKFVTDFIVDSLQPSIESLNVSETETVKAGNLVHLKTMVSARLKTDSTLKDIICTIHPTPAVCGLPKEEAKQFILKNEHYNREFYTGFLGELNFETTTAPRSGKRNIENRAYAVTKKSTQLYVNLRCMKLKNNTAIIYVGGGITANSNPESEWEETVSKSLIIKNIL